MPPFGKNQHPPVRAASADRGRHADGSNPADCYEPWTNLRMRLRVDPGIEALAFLPDVYVFIKDRGRRFIYCGPGFDELMGRPVAELLGRRDEDLSPSYLVDHYRADDNAVLASGIVLSNSPELVRNPTGGYDWHITSKWPLFDVDGEIVGVGGVTRRLAERVSTPDPFSALAPALKMMIEDLSTGAPLKELARSVNLSPSQFSRTFVEWFGMTPQQYRRRIRVDAACELLATTNLPIAQIANQCGYYDQSHLTNELRTIKGMPPGVYRQKFRVVHAEMKLPAAPRSPAPEVATS